MLSIRFALVLIPVAMAAAHQQPTVRLRLATVGNQLQFHIGQPIPVTLDFETDSAQSIRVDTDVRLRHLKPQGVDVFSAAPLEGCVDPLDHLHWTMDGMMHGAGLPSAELDALHPVRIERDLNEFLVFRKPGRYTVHAMSSRVSNQTLQSNDLSLDILARDEAWTAHAFEAATATLEAGKPPKEPQSVFYRDKENAQVDAVRSLRYLETEAATDYLAPLLGEGRQTDDEIAYALYSSPYPDAAVRTLRRKIADPELALTQSYTITLFEVQARAAALQRGHSLSSAERKELDESVNRSVFESAAHKSPRAKADTYYFLFETGSQSLRGSAEVRDKLIESLPFASDYAVQTLLTVFWESIKDAGQTLVPFLKQAALRSPATPAGIRFAGAALLRLRQLDQPAANDIALKELLAGQLLDEGPQLLDFSFPPSAAIDDALISQYKQGKPVDARIGRLASAAAQAEIEQAYTARNASRQSGPPGCVTPLFAYFFRVAPDTASRLLGEMREAAPHSCTALQFYGLERQLMSPGLEQQLITDAKSADQDIRRGAFQMLSVGGSPQALPGLMEALKRASGPGKDDLILAIVHGRHWFPSGPDFAVLKARCSTEQYCGEVRRIEHDSQPPYSLQPFDFNGSEGYWLSNREIDNMDELELVLQGLKPGSAFRWSATTSPMKDDELRRRDAARTLLTSHGMTFLD
jgi:hypothetical protein